MFDDVSSETLPSLIQFDSNRIITELLEEHPDDLLIVDEDPANLPTETAETETPAITIPMNGSKTNEHYERDVLLGRGGGVNKHSGNKVYRRLIEYQKPLYKSLATKEEKSLLIQSILHALKDQGARFLKRDETTGAWCQVSDSDALGKISQAFRESTKGGGGSGGSPSTRKKIVSSQPKGKRKKKNGANSKKTAPKSTAKSATAAAATSTQSNAAPAPMAAPSLPSLTDAPIDAPNTVTPTEEPEPLAAKATPLLPGISQLFDPSGPGQDDEPLLPVDLPAAPRFVQSVKTTTAAPPVHPVDPSAAPRFVQDTKPAAAAPKFSPPPPPSITAAAATTTTTTAVPPPLKYAPLHKPSPPTLPKSSVDVAAFMKSIAPTQQQDDDHGGGEHGLLGAPSPLAGPTASAAPLPPPIPPLPSTFGPGSSSQGFLRYVRSLSSTASAMDPLKAFASGGGLSVTGGGGENSPARDHQPQQHDMPMTEGDQMEFVRIMREMSMSMPDATPEPAAAAAAAAASGAAAASSATATSAAAAAADDPTAPVPLSEVVHQKSLDVMQLMRYFTGGSITNELSGLSSSLSSPPNQTSPDNNNNNNNDNNSPGGV